MGIYYRAAMFVGLPRKELTEIPNLQELLDNDSLQECSASFDNNGDPDNIIGICTVAAGDPLEYVHYPQFINSTKAKFYDLTGKSAKLFLSLDVS